MSELAGLKAELARLQQRVEELEGDGAATKSMSRRTAFKALGAAAVGAAAGSIAFAAPAGAVATMNAGSDNNVTTAPTGIRANNSGWSNTNGYFGGFGVIDNISPSSNTVAQLSAISGLANANPFTTGVLGATTSAAGAGGKFDGPIPLKLTDQTSSGAPSLGSGSQGQFKQASGDLWFCVTGSGSDRWRRIAGTAVAGGYVAIDPARVYDSRWSASYLAAGNSRDSISVADKRFLNGSIDTNNIVPAGARAVTYNITVADTTGAGFIAVTPGGSGSFASSTINWFGDGQVLANGSACKLNSSRQLKVFSGGSGGAHFIVDITGYYL